MGSDQNIYGVFASLGQFFQALLTPDSRDGLGDAAVHCPMGNNRQSHDQDKTAVRADDEILDLWNNTEGR